MSNGVDTERKAAYNNDTSFCKATFATEVRRVLGSSPIKYKLFGGLAIVDVICKYLCLSGDILLIFIQNVSISIDLMSNSC